MYYVALLFLGVAAMLSARLVIAFAARRSSKRIRRVIFWLIGVPLGLLFLLFGWHFVGDELLIFQSPRCFLAVMLFPTVFLLSLFWFGITGFRNQAASAEPCAANWSMDALTKYLAACFVLFVGSAVLFDWQLISQLKALKVDAFATLESMHSSLPSDVNNADYAYDELEQWDKLLIEVEAEIDRPLSVGDGEEISLAGMDVTLLPDAWLQECEMAFQVLRTASASSKLGRPPVELDVVGLQEPPDIDRLRRSLKLFTVGLLVRFANGDSNSACQDIKVLQRIGSQFQGDFRFMGQACGVYAHGLVSRCVARMLRSGEVSAEDLRFLIDESPAAKNAMYNACRWEGARNTVTICKTHLDSELRQAAKNTTPDVTPRTLAFGQMGLRLAHAQDDITALGKRNAFYGPFAKRMDETAVDVDEIVVALGRSMPIGLLQPTDPRDFLIYMTMTGSDSQSLTNLMVAATLYERTNDRYPTTVKELVPDFINQEPVCRRDGLPFRLVAIDDGMVICCSEDEVHIRDALNGEGRLSPARVPWFRATRFLGTAYDQAFGLEAKRLN